MIELRHLRYLVAVADEGHITRASEILGIQQPPLTRQIRQLEALMGAALFERHPRGVRLTEAGRAIIDDARLILNLSRRLPERVQRVASGEAGRIAIGYNISAALNPFVTAAIRAFREAYPAVEVALVEEWSNELVQGLREGRLDAAFTRAPTPAPSDLRLFRLFEEHMVAVAPVGHPLEAAGEVPLSALAGETFVFYRRPAGPGLYDAIIAACQAAGFSPNSGQEAPSLPSTLSLVASGAGVSIVPPSMRRMNVEGVSFLTLTAGAPIVGLHLATRANDRSAVVERFRRAVMAAIRPTAAPSGLDDAA